jgi:HAE1 family hydrophobic/amphiphilic exporter-1
MNLSRIFIERPVATLMRVLAMVLFGALAYKQLPVNDLPQVDFPTLRIDASLPGANPETMANTVAMPLERQLSTVPGIESMSSQSNQGSTRITLQFELARDIDAAAQDV